MKKNTSLVAKWLALATFSSVMVCSCKKDSTTTSTVTPPASAAFTFKLDGGSVVTVDSANATLYSMGGSREIDVYAYKGGVEVLEFHFAPVAGAKTAGTVLGSGAFLTYVDSAFLSYDSQSGSLNLTTCDTVGNKLEGDFNFVGKQYPYTGAASKTITEGHMIVTKIIKQ